MTVAILWIMSYVHRIGKQSDSSCRVDATFSFVFNRITKQFIEMIVDGKIVADKVCF